VKKAKDRFPPEPAQGQELAKGQLWQLSHAYIRIVELGKRLIHYKMMTQPSEAGVRTQISAKDTLWGYLKSRRAKLVEAGSGN
jgi:predicted DNA-binding protein (UPF0251 family)